MIAALVLIFFGLGLIIGSFLNVVIYRFNTDRTFGGRSACMSCGTKLRWFELVPVASFMFLRGRCLHCKAKISFQYPVVELLNGVIFASLFLTFEAIFFERPAAFMAVFAYYAVMFSLLLVVAVYDLKHTVIPDIFSIVIGGLAFGGLFLFDLSHPDVLHAHVPRLSQFLAGFMLAIPFALLWLASSGRWMGLGDAKLALGLGWLLGPAQLLSAAVLSFWIGAVWGVSLLASSRKYTMTSELPFGPFLVLGAFLAFIFGLNIFSLRF